MLIGSVFRLSCCFSKSSLGTLWCQLKPSVAVLSNIDFYHILHSHYGVWFQDLRPCQVIYVAVLGQLRYLANLLTQISQYCLYQAIWEIKGQVWVIFGPARLVKSAGSLISRAGSVMLQYGCSQPFQRFSELLGSYNRK